MSELHLVDVDEGALGRVLANPNADSGRAREIVGRIRQQTARAGEVIRRLREHVAKRNTARLREDVNDVVREAVELGLVGHQYRGVHASVELDPAVGSAMLDRIQIGQVIINLVRNAVEAMETSETRRLTVATHAACSVEVVRQKPAA